MASVIDELTVVLGIDVKSGSYQVFSRMVDGMSQIVKTAATVGAAMAATATSAIYLSERLNQTTAGIGYFSKLTGISTKSIQALGVAVEQIGGNFQSVQSDLMGLTKSMSSPVPGEFNMTLFQLGINVRKASGELKGADEILMNVSDRLKGMPVQEQLQWASRLGFSPDTIRLVQMGSAEIARLRKEAENLPTIVGEQNIKNAQMFVQDMAIIRRIILFIGQEAASFAGPAIRGLVHQFEEWVKTNRDLVESGLQTFIEGTIAGVRDFVAALSTIKSKFDAVFPGFTEFIGKLWNSKLVAALVEGALAAIVFQLGLWLAGLAPLMIEIAAAGIVINDFIAYMNGGESVIGDMIKWVNQLADTFAQKFPNITNFLKVFRDVFKDLGSILKDVVIISLEKVFGWLSKIGGVIGEIFDKVLTFVDTAIGKWGFGEGGGMSEMYTNFYGKLKDQVRAWRGETSSGLGAGKSVGLLSQGMNGVVGGYDIHNYATNPWHVGAVSGLYQKTQGLKTAEEIDRYIQRTAPGSPITGAMVLSTAQRYNVDPGIILAAMQQDSQFGTQGKGARSYNPGNVGNDDSGRIVNMGDWQTGVDAVGKWMSRHKAVSEVPSRSGAQSSSSSTTHSSINITNNIHGRDANDIADRTTAKMNYALQQNYPGGLASVTA